MSNLGSSFSSNWISKFISLAYPSIKPKTAYLSDQKSSGTNGGDATSGSYLPRIVNVLNGDTSFISLDTESGAKTVGVDGDTTRFILNAGTYDFDAVSPAYLIGGYKIKLYNITDSSDVPDLLGNSTICGGAGSDTSVTFSRVYGEFTITSSKTFEIQYRSAVSKGTNGLGGAISFGDNEIYTQAKIIKIG